MRATSFREYRPDRNAEWFHEMSDTPLIPSQRAAVAKYRPDYAQRAHDMAILGANDAQIAARLKITLHELQLWCEQFPEFAAELDAGREPADAKVARAMHKNAVGYEHAAVKFFLNRYKDADGNWVTEVIEHPYIERYQPNVEAGKFWLTNRQPELWRQHQSTELSGGLEVRDGGGLSGLLEATKAARARREKGEGGGG